MTFGRIPNDYNPLETKYCKCDNCGKDGDCNQVINEDNPSEVDWLCEDCQEDSF